MSGSNEKRPIDRLRESAGEMQIDPGDDQSAITRMVSFGDRLLVIKGQGIYEVELADKIDPQRTNPKVPNTYKRIIRYGSDSEFVSRLLLTADVLVNDTILVAGLNRGKILDHALQLTVRFAYLNDIVETYSREENAVLEAVKTSKSKNRSLGIPEVTNVEESCKTFFVHAKHILQSLLNIAAEFFTPELGFFTRLEQLVKENFGESDEFYKFLRDSEGLREFIRRARNSIEHEKSGACVRIKNVRMNESAKIVLPTFQLIDDKYPQEEVLVKVLLQTLFKNLLLFSEAFIAHIAGKHIAAGQNFKFQLMHFPNGHRQNPNIQFGFGVFVNGQWLPLS